jgi:hypothetical protein
MIKLEKTEICGWDAVIRGMRNPLNSWERSDSYWTHIENPETLNTAKFQFFLGENDYDLMTRLRNAGTDHRKYMRMITVYVDITAPLYWWKEYDTYKVGTVANSCSTMHKIHAKEFTLDDFSYEHLSDFSLQIVLQQTVNALNHYRSEYLRTKDKFNWWQMIQLLPSSYNQKRTVMLNYEVLANIYKSRKNHKLDCWHHFCDWIETLPYAKELICGVDKDS